MRQRCLLQAKQSESSPGHIRVAGSGRATETLQTNPTRFLALRQAMNMSPGMDGRAGRTAISDWEHETSLEAADIDLEALPTADEALQSILGRIEQRHKLSMAQVQQACAAQLTALQVSVSLELSTTSLMILAGLISETCQSCHAQLESQARYLCASASVHYILSGDLHKASSLSVGRPLEAPKWIRNLTINLHFLVTNLFLRCV